MAGRGNGSASLGLLMIVASLAVLKLVTAVTYTVGGEGGWKVPNKENGLDYNALASQNTYVVGDELLFTYNKNAHNVLSLPSEAAFIACDVTNATKFDVTGSTTITLKKPGVKFYTCGQPDHCSLGQKFMIMVEEKVGAPSPAATPGSSPSLAIHFTVSAAIALGATALLL